MHIDINQHNIILSNFFNNEELNKNATLDGYLNRIEVDILILVKELTPRPYSFVSH